MNLEHLSMKTRSGQRPSKQATKEVMMKAMIKHSQKLRNKLLRVLRAQAMRSARHTPMDSKREVID